jgi:hypothetical protein
VDELWITLSKLLSVDRAKTLEHGTSVWAVRETLDVVRSRSRVARVAELLRSRL